MLVANVEAPDNIPKDEQPKPYCRPFNKRLEQGFNPWIIQINGLCLMFVETLLMKNFSKILIQFWISKNGEQTIVAKYKDYWEAKWVPKQQFQA
jgi:hypothetical protein